MFINLCISLGFSNLFTYCQRLLLAQVLTLLKLKLKNWLPKIISFLKGTFFKRARVLNLKSVESDQASACCRVECLRVLNWVIISTRLANNSTISNIPLYLKSSLQYHPFQTTRVVINSDTHTVEVWLNLLIKS